MLIEIIEAAITITAVIAYAAVALDCNRAERRQEQRKRRVKTRLQRRRCTNMYRRGVAGDFCVEPEKRDKHLNIICKDPSIAPAWK